MNDAADRPQEPQRTQLDPESAWLAAYALGLAYSSRSQEDLVGLLRDATGGRPELLATAHERLETTEVVEPGLRDRARRLLDRARTLSVAAVPGRLASDGC